jgi:pilus assembly protein CpaE
MVKSVKGLGSHVAVDGAASTFEHGYEMIHKYRPMITIMEIGSDLESAIEKIKTIVDRFPVTNIFATSKDNSSDAILRVIRAGASEYLLRPVSEEDLLSAIQKVGRIWIAKPAADSEKGRIFSVFSPKGGVGTTTIATNLAVSIHEATGKPTLLVDLDLDAGDCTTFLDMKTAYSITDATVNIARLDESFLNGVISKHKTGIYVLVFILTLPGINHVQRYLRYFNDKDIKSDTVKLIVNRYQKRGDIKLEDAERILNHPIFCSIVNDYDTAISSMNKGEPVSVYKRKSPLNTGIEALTKNILESGL